MLETSLEYLAGFFDGEGCVCITKSSRPPFGTHQYILHVSVTQVDPRPLYAFQARFGGHVYTQGKTRRGMQWTITAKRAVPVLEVLLPHLVVKRADAEIGIAFQAALQRNKTHGRTPSAATVAERESFRAQLIELHGSASSVTNRRRA